MIRRSAFAAAIAATAVLAALALVPVPFVIIAPGSAVDLSTRIVVDGHAPPRERYYLTDVTLSRASLLTLAAGFVPGRRLMPQSAIMPSGETPSRFERLLERAMDESQNVAALVAERAAGLHVAEPAARVVVGEILPDSRAAAALAPGDTIEAVLGRRVVRVADVAALVSRREAGSSVTMVVERGGRERRVAVPTIATAAGTRLGIVLERDVEKPELPVPVRYSLENVAGSSGGLMFALQIYAALERARPGRPRAQTIAGTGALDVDGRVRPIEGTTQKLIAARRAGVRLFLVPRGNYPEVSSERGIRVVPVDSFREALSALEAS